MAIEDIGGVWRTVGGRRIFIKDGQTLSQAMKESGKFPNKESREKNNENNHNKNYNNIESFESLKKYENMDDEEYTKSYTSPKDYIMEEMAIENGFNKLPVKVSKEEYDKLVKEKNIRVQRVVSDDINNTADYYVDQFKKGNIYYTNKNNMYGNGIYTSGDVNDIELYSKRNRNSKTIEIIIDKNANIKVFKDQSDLFEKFTNDLSKVPEKYQRAMENPGRLYMSQGIDGIYIEKMNYYIIYNRSKIYVKE